MKNVIKIMLYLLSYFLFFQFIRQIFNIIRYKYSITRCDTNNTNLLDNKMSHDMLIIGDDFVSGMNLNDCNKNIGNILHEKLKANVYIVNNKHLTFNNCTNFIKTYISKIKNFTYDYAIFTIGINDIIHINFSPNLSAITDTISALASISKKVIVLGQINYSGNNIFVFPFNLIIKHRTNNIIDILKKSVKMYRQANKSKNIHYLDINKDIMYNCDKNKYCLQCNNVGLNDNGYEVIAQTLIDFIKKDAA